MPEETGPAMNELIVVGPGGDDVGIESSDASPEGEADSGISALIQQPAKVMRIGTMIRQLLEEVKAAPLDEAARTRLAEIHRQSVKELEDGLSPDLIDELERLSLPFTDDAAPSDAELRIAQAQLVGWLEGLFHGIQAAFFAQQVAAKAQFEQMRGQAQGMPQLARAAEEQNLGHYL